MSAAPTRSIAVRALLRPHVSDCVFRDTATPEIYTLSLHDALPIYTGLPVAVFSMEMGAVQLATRMIGSVGRLDHSGCKLRSEEHTSELQSRPHLVCRLLLEKKNQYFALHLHDRP